ncbi:hypothetical protein [uncultured Tenacibaculum sp.]|uniref:hypothetical protein n=1 Tax=uncultured Tenacibaculum sp. TaxID=174713 RepID=UPI002632940C|nr:hypothetical protein [uncultured Tenacibaculum sp.]
MKKIILNISIIIAIISGIFLIGYLFIAINVWYQFNVGCGMDDGPFEAVKINKIELSEKTEIFKLENGVLILDNRNDTLSPILMYKKNNTIKWVLDTDVRSTKGYENCRISSINDLKINESSKGLNLKFYALWTYGAERGSMNIEKKNGDNKFCLSW